MQKLVMNEQLIKQFLLEKGYATDSIKATSFSDIQYQDWLYKKYKQGKFSIGHLDSIQWLKERQRNATQFGLTLKKNGLIAKGEKVVEVVTDESLSVFPNIILPVEKTSIFEQTSAGLQSAEESSQYHEQKKSILTGKLVINGCYTHIPSYIGFCLKNERPFVIGFTKVGRTDYEKYNQAMLEYYQSLKRSLEMLKPDDTSTIEEEKVLVLSYRTPVKIEEPVTFTMKDVESKR